MIRVSAERSFWAQPSGASTVVAPTRIFQTSNPTSLREGYSFSSQFPNNLFLFDFDQGWMANLGRGVTFSVPILRLRNGGSQTLVRLSYGTLIVQKRAFTNPNSYLVVSDESGNRRIRSTGTSYIVSVDQAQNAMSVYVESGELVTYGADESHTLTTGEGAILFKDHPPIVFPAIVAP